MVNWKDIFCRVLRRRHFLLIDGMHSCVYVPRHTYRKLMRLLYKSIEEDPKAENSLRFLWAKKINCDGSIDYLCIVNPRISGMMSCTHGLVKDNKGRIIIPCPYIQQIYAWFGIAPEWCGRMAVEFLPTHGKALAQLWMRPEKRQKKDVKCTS